MTGASVETSCDISYISGSVEESRGRKDVQLNIHYSKHQDAISTCIETDPTGSTSVFADGMSGRT